MSQKIINVGTLANDGTGDTLRSGAAKINDNFLELYGLTALSVYTTTAYTNPSWINSLDYSKLTSVPTASNSVSGVVKVDGTSIAITSGIIRANLSVSTVSASGSGSLSYSGGVFTFSPPNLSSYATTASLSSYATTGSLSLYATISSLSSYATTANLSSYATTASLNNYVTNSSLSTTLGSYATSTNLTSSLSSYATTASLSSYATTTALTNLIPTQTGNSGKYLTTNGTLLSWATVTGTGTVTSASVVSANGFAGTVANSTLTPAITISTSITGVLKGNATAISAAISGTDYAPGTSALTTGIVKSTTSTGALSIAVAGTDYQSPIGTITGLVKGNGANALTAATAGTDYQAPLPTQSGQTGKYLTTDGSVLSWATVSAGSTLPTQTGQTGKYLTTDGTTLSWSTVASAYTLPATTTTVLGGVVVPAVGTSGITNTSGTIGLATATTTQLGGVKVDGSTVTINGSGVITAVLANAVQFKGGWNASTNTPTLSNTTGTTGWMYVVTTTGTQNLGNGSAVYSSTDFVIFDGTYWIPISSNAGIVSFNTRTGVVTLTSTDVTTALGFTPYNATNPSGYTTNTGDTVGPATATDNAITRFDTTTGKLLQNSLVTITDLGAIVAPIAGSVIPFHYDNQAAFPSATTYHGAIAHSHADGKMYFAHGGAWLALANAIDIPTAQSVTGIVKSSGTTRSAATSGTDYAPGTSALTTGIVKSTTTTGALSIAVAGTDYQTPVSATGILKSSGVSGNVSAATAGTDYIAPYTSQTANYILAAPNGSAGTPVFRAGVIADISNLGTGVATFLATPTSANLASAITDETGSSKVLFSTSPTVTTSLLTDSASFNLLNTTATTVNFAGAATTLSIGAATGTASINNITLTLGNATAINVNGVSPTLSSTSTGTLTLFNTNLLTVNAFNAATTATLANSATSLGIGNTATASQIVNMFTASTGGPSTYNFATGATVSGSTKSISIGTAGASGSTTNINIGSAVSGATSTLTISGSLADATLTSTAKSVGYLGLPQSATATSATLAIGDAGKHIYVTTASQTITIPANASVAYPIGTTITFIAGSSATTVLIAITTDTLRLAGGTSTGTRTLAANGMATAVKVAATTWYINGTGLT